MGKTPQGWAFADVGGRRRPVRDGRPSSPPGKKRLRIKEVAKGRIVKIMLQWKGKLTWSLLMKVINKEFHGEWRPASVANHPELQSLYSATKDRIRKEQEKQDAGKTRKPVDATVTILQNRIDLLQRENGHLKRQVEEYETRLNRWRKNAALNRIPISRLDEPLQENDRGRSDRRR
jgi:hypothetical protein